MNKAMIPQEDLEAINKSFETSREAQAIIKGPRGTKMGAEVKEVNPKSYAFECFGGRILKHSKSVVPVKGPQIFIGEKGQLFDSIPEKLRSQVAWFDSDFE